MNKRRRFFLPLCFLLVELVRNPYKLPDDQFRRFHRYFSEGMKLQFVSLLILTIGCISTKFPNFIFEYCFFIPQTS